MHTWAHMGWPPQRRITAQDAQRTRGTPALNVTHNTLCAPALVHPQRIMHRDTQMDYVSARSGTLWAA